MDDIERQARAVFGNSGNPLGYDDLENLPSDQVEYWLSKRSPTYCFSYYNSCLQ